MLEPEWFVINNLGDFTHKTRILVYNNIGNWDKFDAENQRLKKSLKKNKQKDLDQILSFKESITIIKSLAKKQRNRKTKKNRYVINDDMFLTIIEALNNRMISNIITSLVKKGLLESAYDENINDFIFWIKEDENKENFEKPETD